MGGPPDFLQPTVGAESGARTGKMGQQPVKPGERRFHHIGLRAFESQPEENFVEATRVWVTDPAKDSNKIEWLRYEPDSFLGDDFKDTPHVAWVVDDIGPWIEGKQIAIEPFDVGDPPFATVVFVWEDGMISEYMAFKEGAVWFDPEDAGTSRAARG
jgi:hypothetical protein